MLLGTLVLLSAALQANGAGLVQSASPAENNGAALTQGVRSVCPIEGGGFNELNTIGELLLAEGRTVEAGACFQIAMSRTFGTLRRLSMISAEKGQSERAAAFSHTLAMMDGTPQTMVYHAKRLIQNNQIDEALERLRLAYRLAPQDPVLLDTYGVALFRVGEHSDGLKFIQQAIAIEPTSDMFLGHHRDAQAVIAAAANAQPKVGAPAHQEILPAATGAPGAGSPGIAPQMSGFAN